MKNAIILHGMPSEEEYYDPQSTSQSNKHWLPWLQRQLILNDVLTQAPELPRPFVPEYSEWSKVFKQFTLNEDTVLIGHGCGAGFLVRWLSENPNPVGKLILVAPWIDPYKELKNGFFDFSIDTGLGSNVGSIEIFVSDDDDQDIQESVRLLESAVPSIRIHRYENMGHFTYGSMGTEKFPHLVDVIFSKSDNPSS